jgi:glycosyltransferase involved in cell wall biosynthesis
MRAAEALPVTFHVNAARETLEDLYRRASVYWHATGLGTDLARHPEHAEHFGISLVEAMAGECVPMAFNAGGPREIITHGVDGFLYASTEELVALTADILRPQAADRRQAIGRAAGARARMFAPERFGARVREVLLAP